MATTLAPAGAVLPSRIPAPSQWLDRHRSGSKGTPVARPREEAIAADVPPVAAQAETKAAAGSCRVSSVISSSTALPQRAVPRRVSPGDVFVSFAPKAKAFARTQSTPSILVPQRTLQEGVLPSRTSQVLANAANYVPPPLPPPALLTPLAASAPLTPLAPSGQPRQQPKHEALPLPLPSLPTIMSASDSEDRFSEQASEQQCLAARSDVAVLGPCLESTSTMQGHFKKKGKGRARARPSAPSSTAILVAAELARRTNAIQTVQSARSTSEDSVEDTEDETVAIYRDQDNDSGQSPVALLAESSWVAAGPGSPEPNAFAACIVGRQLEANSKSKGRGRAAAQDSAPCSTPAFVATVLDRSTNAVESIHYVQSARSASEDNRSTLSSSSSSLVSPPPPQAPHQALMRHPERRRKRDRDGIGLKTTFDSSDSAETMEVEAQVIMPESPPPLPFAVDGAIGAAGRGRPVIPRLDLSPSGPLQGILLSSRGEGSDLEASEIPDGTTEEETGSQISPPLLLLDDEYDDEDETDGLIVDEGCLAQTNDAALEEGDGVSNSQEEVMASAGDGMAKATNLLHASFAEATTADTEADTEATMTGLSESTPRSPLVNVETHVKAIRAQSFASEEGSTPQPEFGALDSSAVANLQASERDHAAWQTQDDNPEAHARDVHFCMAIVQELHEALRNERQRAEEREEQRLEYQRRVDAEVESLRAELNQLRKKDPLEEHVSGVKVEAQNESGDVMVTDRFFRTDPSGQRDRTDALPRSIRRRSAETSPKLVVEAKGAHGVLLSPPSRASEVIPLEWLEDDEDDLFGDGDDIFEFARRLHNEPPEPSAGQFAPSAFVPRVRTNRTPFLSQREVMPGFGTEDIVEVAMSPAGAMGGSAGRFGQCHCSPSFSPPRLACTRRSPRFSPSASVATLEQSYASAPNNTAPPPSEVVTPPPSLSSEGCGSGVVTSPGRFGGGQQDHAAQASTSFVLRPALTSSGSSGYPQSASHGRGVPQPMRVVAMPHVPLATMLSSVTPLTLSRSLSPVPRGGSCSAPLTDHPALAFPSHSRRNSTSTTPQRRAAGARGLRASVTSPSSRPSPAFSWATSGGSTPPGSGFGASVVAAGLLNSASAVLMERPAPSASQQGALLLGQPRLGVSQSLPRIQPPSQASLAAGVSRVGPTTNPPFPTPLPSGFSASACWQEDANAPPSQWHQPPQRLEHRQRWGVRSLPITPPQPRLRHLGTASSAGWRVEASTAAHPPALAPHPAMPT